MCVCVCVYIRDRGEKLVNCIRIYVFELCMVIRFAMSIIPHMSNFSVK